MRGGNKNRKKISAVFSAAGACFIFAIIFFAQIFPASAESVPTPRKDPQGVESNTGEQTSIEMWKINYEQKQRAQKDVGANVYKKALSYFLKTIAIDVATYLASGGEGQQPLFYTEGWGTYLTRVADNAAGHFINDFAQGLGIKNICSFRFNVRLAITLGLKQAERPRPPVCTFTQLLNNWERSLTDPNTFLKGIDASFDPTNNELAASLNVFSNFYEAKGKAERESVGIRQEGQGFRAVTDNITGYIKTPAQTVFGIGEKQIDETTGQEKIYTDHPVADAINAFTNTLASKFLERMFQKGLALKASLGKEERFNWNNVESLLIPEASPNRPGRAEARQEFAATLSPRVTIGNPTANRIDVTTELLSEGIISPKFKTAVDRGLTVSQAIQEGLLQTTGAGATFGFTSQNKQPDSKEGYSYNSFVILRKYRILPVGWELAASYIKENAQDRIFSLGDIISQYDNPSSPFYRMIDVNWVLKAPETFCRLEGPGEELSLSDWRVEKNIDESRNPPKEYELNRQTVSRKDSCADSKSCIYEDGDGNCLYYGYCTEEKSLWRLHGESCPAYYNTCQKFVDEKNNSFAYLFNTINSKDCSIDNVGCQWYCADFNKKSSQWTCLVDGERALKACDNSAGCPVVDPATGETCTIEYKALGCVVSACKQENNLLANSGFEKFGTSAQDPSGWNVFGDGSVIQRVSGSGQKVFSEKYSLRMSYFGGLRNRFVALSSPVELVVLAGGGAKAYTISGKIFSSLTYGAAYLALADASGNLVAGDMACSTNPDMEKGDWTQVSCTLSIQEGDYSIANGNALYIGAILEDKNYPVGDVWFDDVSFQPACPDRDVVVRMNAEDSVDQSKIYFDKEVRECDSEQEGCHKFLRTKLGLGANLLPNGSFEEWNEEDAPQWWTRTAPGGTIQKIIEEPYQGKNALSLENVGIRQVLPDIFNSQEKLLFSFFGKRNSPGNQGQITASLEYTDSAGAHQILLMPNLITTLTTTTLEDKWQRHVLGPITVPQGQDFEVRVVEVGGGPGSIIDALMLEEVESDQIAQEPGAYSEYGEKNAVFLKQPPAYLECTGNPETDNSRCNKFALLCNKDEVGCQRYAPTNGDPPVPGVITSFDRCPKECAGYDAFKQSATNFEQEKLNNFFIPNTAQQCSAVDAGCDEFTNLDEVARGGEGKEYFKYIRHCQKPNNSCQTFYTWVGSDVAGYQLKVYRLRDAFDNSTGAAAPDSIPDLIPSPRTDLGDCANATDAATNPNCREFYSTSNGAGAAQYIIVQNTIACTDQCFPYRLNGTIQQDCERSGGAWGVCGQDTTGDGIIDQPPLSCEAVGGFILPGSGECWTRALAIVAPIPVKGCNSAPGLVFNTKNQCVYQAVPEEGEKCPAQSSGCREYRGNSSANVRVLFSDTFEAGAPVNWNIGEISNDALAVGGHSLESEFSGAVQRFSTFRTTSAVCANTLPACSDSTPTSCWNEETRTCYFGTSETQRCIAQEGSGTCGILDGILLPKTSYLISFWAKKSIGIPRALNLSIVGTATRPVGSVSVGTEWQEYRIGPFELPETVIAPGMRLNMNASVTAAGADEKIHIDFLNIKQVQEYNYLIKNSWNTPVSCDTNPYTDPPARAPQFMLGCQEYLSGEGKNLFLKSFDTLCRDSAVGCEKLIDTHNTDSPYAQAFNEEHPLGRVDISADSSAYMVNSPSAQCAAAAKGCSAYGEPAFSGDGAAVLGYEKKYFVNDPEQYSAVLCNEDNVGCRQYASEQDGVVFMKDPKKRTCEYRQVQGTNSYGWFANGTTNTYPDCPTDLNNLGVELPGKSCIGGDTPGLSCVKDDECLGGGKCVEWAGMCPEESAGCTAYVDPQSIINTDILVNGNFEGYTKVCTLSRTPCAGAEQCPAGEECGPDTKLNQWILSDAASIQHLRGEGYLKSSGVFINSSRGPASVSQGRILEKGTLYTVFARSKLAAPLGGQIEIVSSGNNSFAHFDNSVQINSAGNTLTLPLVNTSDEYKITAGRFFVTDRDASVSIRIVASAGYFDDVQLKKTGIYYYLARDVDKRSCNSTANIAQGCVLFNDTSQGFLSFNSLITQDGSQAELCKNEGCDSNAVVKVTPDRDCAKWLECVSGREQINFKTGKKENFCQQISECTSLNPVNGQCNNFPPPVQEVQEFDPGSIELIKNISGYAKVGFSWDVNAKLQGYYPYSAMEQKKVCVKPDEKAGDACIEDEDCESAPLKRDGLCQPILQVRDDKFLYQSCRMYPEGGSPRWGEKGPNDTGDKPSAPVITDINNPLGLKFWTKFGIDSTNQKILADASECSYKKDNTLFEGIYGFCVEKDPRSPYLCLNWLPVDEITGGWIGVSGWVDEIRDQVYYCTEGAALEYRRPASESKCYQSDFWSLENMGNFFSSQASMVNIILDGFNALPIIGEITGDYQDVLNDQILDSISTHKSCGQLVCPIGYVASISDKKCGSFFQPGNRCTWRCTPRGEDYKFTDSEGINWYDYKVKVDKDGKFTKKHIMYCADCGNGKVIYDPEEPKDKEPKGWLRVCDAVAKVSDDDGSNRAWKRRTEAIRDFKDSGYIVPDYKFTVDAFNYPFGSLGKFWKGDPAAWPYLTDLVNGKQFELPLFDIFNEGENVGQIFHDSFSDTDPIPFLTTPQGGRERIKRLFSQSYGNWKWNGTNYQLVPKDEKRCYGGPNDGADCKAGADICLDGTPPRQPSRCEASPGYCEYYDSAASSTKVADKNVSCTDDPNAASAQCAGKIFCATKFCRTSDVDTSSFTACRDIGDCTGGENCLPLENGAQYGFCSIHNDISCTKPGECPRGEDCTTGAGVGYCAGGLKLGQACGAGTANAAGCNTANTRARCVGKCSLGSAVASEECRQDSECQIDGECVEYGFWAPPVTVCPSNVRTNYFTEKPADPADPLAPGDWCGVAPIITGAQIQNTLASPFEIHGGSGEVVLQFNVKVDDNQLPMKRLEIHWGDAQPSTVTAPRLGLRDKSDASDPFIFPHVYTYDKAFDRGCNIDPTKPCNGYSEYKIHILVKDNWGWCTCKDLSACRPASTADGDCPGQFPKPNPSWEDLDASNSWFSVETMIWVHEN